MRQLTLAVLFTSLAAVTGCASLPEPVTVRGQSPFAELVVDAPKGGRKRDEKKENGAKAKNGKDEDQKDKDKKDKHEKDKKDNDEKKDKDEKKEKGPPKTLFEWAIGPEVEDKEEEEE